jgi:hypothetical protein
MEARRPAASIEGFGLYESISSRLCDSLPIGSKGDMPGNVARIELAPINLIDCICTSAMAFASVDCARRIRKSLNNHSC